MGLVHDSLKAKTDPREFKEAAYVLTKHYSNQDGKADSQLFWVNIKHLKPAETFLWEFESANSWSTFLKCLSWAGIILTLGLGYLVPKAIDACSWSSWNDSWCQSRNAKSFGRRRFEIAFHTTSRDLERLHLKIDGIRCTNQLELLSTLKKIYGNDLYRLTVVLEFLHQGALFGMIDKMRGQLNGEEGRLDGRMLVASGQYNLGHTDEEEKQNIVIDLDSASGKIRVLGRQVIDLVDMDHSSKEALIPLAFRQEVDVAKERVDWSIKPNYRKD